MTNRISELEKQISAANLAYSKGLPFMTDSEYDLLWKELHRYDPNNSILYHTANDPNLPDDLVPHKFQIMGTNKAFNIEDLKPFMTRFGDSTLRLEPKYDGCAAILYLGRDDTDDRLILEGNGISGRDISHHIPKIHCAFEPRNMESIELIIPVEGWDPEFGANPRNVVAGWLARKEIPHQNLVQMVSHNQGELHQEYDFDGDYDKFVEVLLTCFAKWSAKYPLDGIMIKPLSEQRRIIAGHNGTTYQWSIAWKPPMQTKETTVTGIEWNVSRTGRVVPTVIYEPIELCHTTNSRVTANNAMWLVDKRVTVGGTIIIGKAGEIIPKIIDVTGYGAEASGGISSCPICGNELQWKGVDLICDGSECIAQLTKSLEYFYSDKGMDVNNLGEYRIAELLEHYLLLNTLKEKPWALLDPIHYGIYDDICKILGMKITNNYLEGVQRIKGKKHAVHFIAALGRPGLAYKTALKLFNFVRTGEIKSHVPVKAQQEFAGALLQFNQAQEEMTNFSFIPVPPPATITYCITGTLSGPRPAMIEKLEHYGWEFSNQVSKFTDYLIVGDSPGRTKTTKAKELGTTNITEEDLRSLLK